MAKTKPTSLDALQKLHAQRHALDQREAELRNLAAGEIGTIVIECGAELLDAARLKALLKHVTRIGLDEALSLLGSQTALPARHGS